MPCRKFATFSRIAAGCMHRHICILVIRLRMRQSAMGSGTNMPTVALSDNQKGLYELTLGLVAVCIAPFETAAPAARRLTPAWVQVPRRRRVQVQMPSRPRHRATEAPIESNVDIKTSTSGLRTSKSALQRYEAI